MVWGLGRPGAGSGDGRERWEMWNEGPRGKEPAKPFKGNSHQVVLCRRFRVAVWFCGCLLQGTHCTGKTEKTGEMAKKTIPGQGNIENLEILPKHWENTGNLVCSSCKFLDSKGKGYCDICSENFHFFPQKLDRSAKSVLSM